MSTIAKPPLHRIALFQLLIAAVFTGVLGVVHESVTGYSFFIGCLIQIAGNLYFARQAWRFQGARQARMVVQAMYLGVSGKILLTAMMFALVFALIKPLNIFFVFAGYLAMFAIYVAMTANLLKRKHSL